MGRFATLVCIVLEEHQGRVVGNTEVLEFPNGRWVSWQGRDLPADQWTEKGVGSIFFEAKGNRAYERSYTQSLICSPVQEGLVRRRSGYKFNASFENLELCVFHVVLPPISVPAPGSLNPEPRFTSRIENRVALTWTFVENPQVSFVFRKARPREFAGFKTEGEPFETKTTEGFRMWIRGFLADLKEDGKDVMARALDGLLKK